LTLLSGPAGTALIDNTGGLVLGTGTMQRYLDNQTLSGYRHYSAPVSNTTLGNCWKAFAYKCSNSACQR